MAQQTQNSNEATLDEIRNEVANEQLKKAKSGERIQLIVFKLAGEEYALPIDDIKEVVITPKIAKIPQTPDYIKGVANIRGNIIAIMDMDERLNLKGESNGKLGSYTLVIESEEYKVGILVTEVPNTLNTYSSEIDTSSEIMQFSVLDKESIKGIVKDGNRLIMLLDIFQLIKTVDLNKIVNI